MKTILAILLVTFCAAMGYAQTIRTLGYNSSNGMVVTGTNALIFTNEIQLSGVSGIVALHGGPQIRMQSDIQGTGFRAVLSDSTNTINNATYNGTNYFLTVSALGTNVAVFRPQATELLVPLQFNNTTNAAATRTNLGFPFPALTNTSNVTMMRALSGSTNTNHPFSGSVSVVGTNNTNTLIFSNGVLQEIQ